MPELDLPEVPMPQVLDPDRLIMPERDDMTIDEHRGRTDAVLTQLRRTCEYGRQLWHELEAVRAYLGTNVPADADDAQAWLAWRTRYAAVVSSLAGTMGDSGFGADEAMLIAQNHGSFGGQA